MAFQHDAVEAQEHRAIMVVGVEMVAQQFGRGARDQETDLRARRTGEGTAQEVGDEARRPLDRLERDIPAKPSWTIPARKSTRLTSSHYCASRMPSSA